MSFLDELQWRGLVHSLSKDVDQLVAKEKLAAYIGFDPSADSLHVGSLLQITLLQRLQRHGHHPIALVGGGTGLIGDPSGKSSERALLPPSQVEENVAGIRAQLERHLDFESATNPARLVNNAEWLTSIALVDFLRDVGKHFTVNYMLAKDSVDRRIQSEDGISFTEFSYMMLQAYDFLMLFDRHACRLQLGGSDQWGNITAGIDLIRKARSGSAHGIVVPLITNAQGTKFGKTEAGTIWLDSKRTSPYRFYQFWLNTSDADAVPYLKCFTWLDAEEIAALEASLRSRPDAREAQTRLARELVRAVHGESALERAEAATRVLFGAELDALDADEVLEIFGDAPSSDVPRARLQGAGLTLGELLVATGLAPSKSEARRLLSGGGVYLNNRRAAESERVAIEGCIAGRFLVLRKGRKHYHLVRVVDADAA